MVPPDPAPDRSRHSHGAEGLGALASARLAPVHPIAIPRLAGQALTEHCSSLARVTLSAKTQAHNG